MKRPKNTGDPNWLKSVGCVLTLGFVDGGERNLKGNNRINKGWEFRQGFKGERVIGCYWAWLWRWDAGILFRQNTAQDLQIEFSKFEHSWNATWNFHIGVTTFQSTDDITGLVAFFLKIRFPCRAGCCWSTGIDGTVVADDVGRDVAGKDLAQKP